MVSSVVNRPVNEVGIVLVAEDDQDVGDSIREILELAGHRVLVARDGGEALRALAENDVDVLVLDLNMPVVDGWTVLREIRGCSRPAVIVNSGEEFSSEQMREFFETRPFGVLSKPTPPRYLLKVVDSALTHLRTLADERDSAADERDRVADRRDTVADERDRVADRRDVVADERDRVADRRDVVADERDAGNDAGRPGAADREGLTEQRRSEAGERATAAAERVRIDAERRIADDARQVAAEERDRTAVDRERLVGEQKRLLDEVSRLRSIEDDDE